MLVAPDRPAFLVPLLVAGLAFALPPLPAFDSLPMASLPTDVVALVGCGAWIALVGARTASSGRSSTSEPGLRAPLGLLAVLTLAALGSRFLPADRRRFSCANGAFWPWRFSRC